MFTGIVQAQGQVESLEPTGSYLRMRVGTGEMSLADGAMGESIAVNGCCLTVADFDGRSFAVDVSGETIARTAGFAPGEPVNLERALRASDRLGGHLVSGHVDGVGRVLAFARAGEGWDLAVGCEAAILRYVARKGSITINGVSLTVNWVDPDRFGVHIIPHTATVTNLGSLATGSPVNLEVDLIARYCERLLGVSEYRQVTVQNNRKNNMLLND